MDFTEIMWQSIYHRSIDKMIELGKSQEEIKEFANKAIENKAYFLDNPLELIELDKLSR